MVGEWKKKAFSTNGKRVQPKTFYQKGLKGGKIKVKGKDERVETITAWLPLIGITIINNGASDTRQVLWKERYRVEDASCRTPQV